jgi:hypothetical protein
MKVYLGRKIKFIKIDSEDTWNVDHTLALIIVPLLQRMKLEKHGAPFVDDADVPWYYRDNVNKQDEHGLSEAHFKKYDWVVDEMIWTFQQFIYSDWEISRYFRNDKFDQVGYDRHNESIENGLRLFAKYYRTLWT